MSTHTTCPYKSPDEMLIPVPQGWTWTLTAPDGYTVAGYPPAHTLADSTTTSDRPSAITDCVTWYDDGIPVPVTFAFGTGPTIPWDILAVRINRHPTSGAPGTASIQLINDHWLTDLGPTDLTHLAAQGHTFLDSLTHAVQSPAPGRTALPGIHATVTTDHGPAHNRQILTAFVDHTPANGTKPPTTTTNIHIIGDCGITALTPSALADFTTQAHAYFDRLTRALQPTAPTPGTDDTTV